MKRFLCLIMVVVLCLMTIPAYAEAQIVEDIKDDFNGSIGEILQFSDMQYFSDGYFEIDSINVPGGIVLLWYLDKSTADVVLFSSEDLQEGYKWSIENISETMDDTVVSMHLTSLIYGITFNFIATESSLDMEPLKQIEYGPDTDEDEFFDELNKFLADVENEKAEEQKIEEVTEEKTVKERPSYNGKPLAIGGLPDDVVVSIVDTLTKYVPTMKDLFVNPYSVEIKEAKYLFDGDFWFKFLCTNKMGGTVVEELLLYKTDSGWVLDGSSYMISTKLNMMTHAQREFSKNDIAWVNSLL